jgi:hypothetical protein
MKHWRSLSIAIGAALLLANAGIPAAGAEEAKPAAAAEPAAAPASPADGMMMEGCSGAANGACCGSRACQQAKQDVAAKAEGGGGCPCQQRARRAREAEQARQQAQ